MAKRNKLIVVLNEKAAAQYELVQWPLSKATILFSAQYGEINLKTIRPESIEQLIGRGCPYFKAKAAQAAEATTHEWSESAV